MLDQSNITHANEVSGGPQLFGAGSGAWLDWDPSAMPEPAGLQDRTG